VVREREGRKRGKEYMKEKGRRGRLVLGEGERGGFVEDLTLGTPFPSD
jgi:hypothetical protein